MPKRKSETTVNSSIRAKKLKKSKCTSQERLTVVKCSLKSFIKNAKKKGSIGEKLYKKILEDVHVISWLGTEASIHVNYDLVWQLENGTFTGLEENKEEIKFLTYFYCLMDCIKKYKKMNLYSRIHELRREFVNEKNGLPKYYHKTTR